MKMNEDFDKIIKKEKRKKIVKTFVISVVTTLALLFIGYTVSNRGMALQYEKAKEMANITDMIESPNLISRSQYLSKTGWVTSQLKSDRFKNIQRESSNISNAPNSLPMEGCPGSLSTVFNDQ